MTLAGVDSYPMCPIKDGFFEPLAISPGDRAREIRERVQRTNLTPEVDVFLRGSVLEEPTPHPEADLDLVVVCSRRHWADVSATLQQTLAPLGRPIDLLPIEPNDLQVAPSIRLLITTRSLHLSGRCPLFPLVAADLRTMKAHWFRYAPFNLPSVLTSSRRRRVCELKLLTRSFGVLEFFSTGRFSRGIKTCLHWAREINPEAGLRLHRFWTALEDGKALPDMNIDPIRQAFLERP